MSIDKRKRRGRDGKAYMVWRVRWYDEGRGSERSKTFPRGTKYEVAEAFETRVKTLKRAGGLDRLDAGRETLADFAERWWADYAAVNLAVSTLDCYARIWNRHVLPRVGHYRLRELNPEIVGRLRADLERDQVGAPTVRKALAILQGMCSRAVEWRHLEHNPVVPVRKPHAERQRPIKVVPPELIERLRGQLLGDGRRAREIGMRDATLVSVLAYAGPRPREPFRLLWEDIGVDTILMCATKTRKRFRTVDLLSPLAQDLAEWRMACGRPPSSAPVFTNAAGEPWGEEDYRRWRKHHFKPAANAVGLEELVPYDLRHSFVSLLLREGQSPVEVADQLGHSPQMTLNTYGHVIRELKNQPRIPAADQIRAARETGLGSQPTLGAM